MNTNGNLVLAGSSVGAVSVMAVHAQEAKTPFAYLVAETEVSDRAAFQNGASVSRIFMAEGLSPQ